MSIARRTNARTRADEPTELDVPAAVLCARCGSADCPGCDPDDGRSGVVAVVPWERPGIAPMARLWATARASTFDAERFFESLPDGPVAPALSFAVLCEVLASAAMAVAVLTPVAALAPQWSRHVVSEQGPAVLRLGTLGVPLVAALLVLAHAAHGWALDRGARRGGAAGSARRALRFGLYACGWDLVIGPLGVVVVGVRKGPLAALALGAITMGVPGRSARAFLRGCYHLDGPAAAPALNASYLAAGVSAVVAALVVIAGFIAAVVL